jgi:Secreted Novel AID/APOBEC-like Deaminase 4
MGLTTNLARALAQQNFETMSDLRDGEIYFGFKHVTPKSELMSGALVVFDRGTNKYLFDIKDNYFSETDTHVETTLLNKLDSEFPSYSIPNNARVVVYTFYSPCQRCAETIHRRIIEGSEKLNPAFRKSWLKNSVGTQFKFVYLHAYLGTGPNHWPDQNTMDQAYAGLVGASNGRLRIVPLSQTKQKNNHVATDRGGPKVW